MISNYSTIRGSKGKYPYHEGSHLIVALSNWVYLDESGTHKDAKYCIVGGYRGSPRQWDRFNKDWRAILAKHNIESGFHANVFFHRKLNQNIKENPYYNWTLEHCMDFLEELLTVIRKRKIAQVGCAVKVFDFQELSYGEQCVFVGYEPPKARRQLKPESYHLCMHHVVQIAVQDVERATELHFVIAHQQDLQQRAIDGYYLVKGIWEEYGGSNERWVATKQLKGIGVEDPLDVPALQAADLLVNRWYHYMHHPRGSFDALHIKAMNGLTKLGKRTLPTLDSVWMEQVLNARTDRENLRTVPRPY